MVQLTIQEKIGAYEFVLNKLLSNNPVCICPTLEKYYLSKYPDDDEYDEETMLKINFPELREYRPRGVPQYHAWWDKNDVSTRIKVVEEILSTIKPKQGMEKIFDQEARKYLEEYGVTLTQIQRIKFDVLKKCAIERLELVTKHLKNDNFKAIENMLSYSPSGDSMGGENYYIEFGDIITDRKGIDGCLDMMGLINLLEHLKQWTVLQH